MQKAFLFNVIYGLVAAFLWLLVSVCYTCTSLDWVYMHTIFYTCLRLRYKFVHPLKLI